MREVDRGYIFVKNVCDFLYIYNFLWIKLILLNVFLGICICKKCLLFFLYKFFCELLNLLNLILFL